MDTDISEALTCPICCELPKGEIFQCINGHSVCGDCLNFISQCPQCRVPYGSTKVRNRALENVLDKLKLDCTFKSKGCNTKVCRGEFASHTKNCSYGDNVVKLCEQLGHTCGFGINPIRIQEAVTHFRQIHNSTTATENNFCMRLRAPENMLSSYTSYIPSPVIVDHYGQIFLVMFTVSTDQSCGYLHCIMLTKNGNACSSDFRVEFSSKSLNPTQAPDLVWMGPPTYIKQSLLTIIHPIFRFPRAISPHYASDNHIDVSFKITKLS